MKKIEEIADCLEQSTDLDIGLLTGEPGRCLFQFVAHSLTDNQKKYPEVIKKLEAIFDKIEANSYIIDTHCGGLAGLGWLVEFASEQGFLKADTNEVLEFADQYLDYKLKVYLHRNNWDFLHGATGLGFYFLKRHKHKPQTAAIKNLIDFLSTTGSRTDKQGIKWLSVIDRKTNEKGYNISLSHGMASIVVFLTKVYSQQLFIEETSDLLNGAVSYILAQEVDVHRYGAYFPVFSLESDKSPRKSRLAWCYGDLGIAMAVYQAGRILQRKDWTDKAVSILLYAAGNRRDLEKEAVMDAGLCHGTAGIGHIFYRMWWNTRLPEFKEAADYWFNETLTMAKFEDGLAGYKTYHREEGWAKEYGLLEGVSGIGLAMLSYMTDTEPTWDECLLLS
jgi:lantibiotic modifying enzyme